LVVGTWEPLEENQLMVVLACNGDGTFTKISEQPSGGNPWMIVFGDLNGDGHEDINTVISDSNQGAMLFGDGEGNLSEPVLYETDSFPLATDVGDLDGDGNLDWISSGFSGDWWFYKNDGSGGFEFDVEFDATIAASCALLYDSDNDGDLDLALIDEIEDEIICMQNTTISNVGYYDVLK